MTLTTLITLNATLALLVVVAIVVLLGSAIRAERDVRTASAAAQPARRREHSDRLAA
jgi:hypothetical protein